jgi:hypothetical protein
MAGAHGACEIHVQNTPNAAIRLTRNFHGIVKNPSSYRHLPPTKRSFALDISLCNQKNLQVLQSPSWK